MPPILLMKRTLDDLEDLYDFDDSDETDDEEEILEPNQSAYGMQVPLWKSRSTLRKSRNKLEKMARQRRKALPTKSLSF
jgi:hypothetical protein